MIFYIQIINLFFFSIDYFSFKPESNYYVDEVESENEDEDEDEDVFDAPTTTTTKTINNEHSDPNSYSWLVLKLATLRITQNRLLDFLAVSNIDLGLLAGL